MLIDTLLAFISFLICLLEEEQITKRWNLSLILYHTMLRNMCRQDGLHLIKKVVVRLLEQHQNLKEYFLTYLPTTAGFKYNVEKTDRYKRICDHLQSELTIVSSRVIPTFQFPSQKIPTQAIDKVPPPPTTTQKHQF